MAIYGLLAPFITLAGMALQAGALQFHDLSAPANDHDLVFMHVPYNFGHTIEFARAMSPQEMHAVMAPSRGGFHGGNLELPAGLVTVRNAMAKAMKPDYEPWGRLDLDLSQVSEVTGWPLYFSPQKYWPQDVAEAYFGNRTVFGVLRDPYERLVAEFRGGFSDYGGVSEKFSATCDVNGAIKEMMSEALNSSDPFVKQCAYVPQAEYFDGPYGIKLAIDNRRFPSSMNEAFEAHRYSEHIATEDVMHVSGCNNVWAGDLDAEARSMVRKVYARDFELLCSLFGYCDWSENTCLQEVEHMCPQKAFQWDLSSKRYVPRQA
jgi:hypothetical protein